MVTWLPNVPPFPDEPTLVKDYDKIEATVGLDGAYYQDVVCCDCGLAHHVCVTIEDGKVFLQFARIHEHLAERYRQDGLRAGHKFLFTR